MNDNVFSETENHPERLGGILLYFLVTQPYKVTLDSETILLTIKS
jgi:hypothetical protein